MTRPTDNVRIKEFANEILIPEIISILNSGHTVTLGLRGFSMRPFLEDRRDKALLSKPSSITVGDVVLAEVATQRYALHRIISINGDDITLRGDGNIGVEHCKRKDIHGFAEGFYRKGRTTLEPTSGRKWRVYSFLWIRLFPVRRYLLFAYRVLHSLRLT